MKIFYLFSALRGLALGIYSPIWIIFLIKNDYSLLDIGLLGAVFEIAKFIFEVPLGAFADRFGVKTSIIGSFLFSVMTWVLFPFSHSLIFCITVMILWAISDSLISGAYEAWMSRIAGVEEFGKEMMKNTQIMIVTLIVGSLASGFIYIVNSTVPFILVTLIYLILLVIMYFVEVPKISIPLHQEIKLRNILFESLKIILNEKRVLLIILSGLFTVLAYDAINRYWQPYLTESGFSEEYLGIVFAISGICCFLLLTLTVKYNHKIESNPYSALNILEISGIVLCSVLAIGFKPLSAIATPILLALEDIRQPIVMSYLNKFFPEEYKSTLFSLNSGIGAIGEVLSGIIFGLIAVKFGLSIMLIVVAIVLVPALLIYAIIPRSGSKVIENLTN